MVVVQLITLSTPTRVEVELGWGVVGLWQFIMTSLLHNYQTYAHDSISWCYFLFLPLSSNLFIYLLLSSLLFLSLSTSSYLFYNIFFALPIPFLLVPLHSVSLSVYLSSSSLTSFFLFLTCCTRQGKTILGEVKILNNVLGTRDPLIFIVDHYPQMFNLGISRSRR